MAFSWKTLGIGLLCVLVLIAGRLANYYHGKYTAADEAHQVAETKIKEKQGTIDEMKHRQQELAALDAKNLQELADAQSEIEALRADVANNRRRLQLSATCGKSGTATGTTGQADATAPRLTDAAQQNYFTLRDRIAAATNQILGLQAYINTQCVKAANGSHQ